MPGNHEQAEAKPLSAPWTVDITLRVWPDHEGSASIVDEVEAALRPLLGRGEGMTIEIARRS